MDLKEIINNNKKYDMIDNNNIVYKDENGYYHLFRNNTEIIQGVKAISVHSYTNGGWEYEDEYGYFHLFKDGVELTKNVKATDVYLYDDGIHWSYKDKDGYYHQEFSQLL